MAGPSYRVSSWPAPAVEYVDNFTFGIELEFEMLYPWEEFDGRGFDLSPMNIVHQQLLKAGLPVITAKGLRECGMEMSYDMWIIQRDKHEFTEDEKSCAPQWAGYVPFELTSPKFRFRNEHIWRPQIEQLLAVIKNLPYLHDGIRVTCNEETGFHVHVGNDTSFPSVRTAKNVLQTVTAFERCFDLLHSAQRIRHRHCHASSPSKFFVHKSADPARWLKIIESVQSYGQLQALFHHPSQAFAKEPNGKTSAYNFDNLGGPNKKNTIEFRQHAGTLVLEEIISWLTVCVHVVRTAALSDYEAHMRYVKAHMREEMFSILHVLEYIKAPPKVLKHFLRRLALLQQPTTLTCRQDGFGLLGTELMNDACGEDLDLMTPKSHPLRQIMEQVEHNRWNEEHTLEVAAAMTKKLMEGEYGDWNSHESESRGSRTQSIDRFVCLPVAANDGGSISSGHNRSSSENDGLILRGFLLVDQAMLNSLRADDD